MAKKGFKSFTVSDETLTRITNVYQKLKTEKKLPPGVHSVAGLVDYHISKKIEDGEQLRKLATKIKIVPSEFLTTYHRINLEVCKIE